MEISEKGVTAKDLVYAWQESDDDNSWTKVLDTIPAFLADRGLVKRMEVKKLKVFTVTDHELLDETRELAQEAPVEPIRTLLSACEKDRPGLWKQLLREINQAVNASGSGADAEY